MVSTSIVLAKDCEHTNPNDFNNNFPKIQIFVSANSINLENENKNCLIAFKNCKNYTRTIKRSHQPFFKLGAWAS